MAPGNRQKKAASKPATSTRTTRARSKEAAPQPPPIAPSRRSTRATSNEPLLQLADPNKILRKARKTPEVQPPPMSPQPAMEATTEPPTPYLDEEPQQDAPSSPTPVIIETNEVEEYEMSNAPSSPTPAVSKVEADIEVDVEVEGEIEVNQASSPFEELPQPRSLSPAEDASAYSGIQSRMLSPIDEETPTQEPPRVDEALQIFEQQRELHHPAAITSSPPNASIRQASPTTSVFYTPTEDEKPAQGGLLSVLASPFRAIATPVSRLSRLLGRGAKTQPSQKTAPAPAIKAMSTPNFSRSHAQSASTPDAQLSPYLENFLERNTPSYNHTNRREANVRPSQPITPSQQAFTTNTPAASHTRSTLFLDDGRPVPKEFRNWIGHTRSRQQRDMDTVQRRDMEVASGDRVLTPAEQAFKERTLLRQRYLEHWRSRQPGNQRKTALHATSQVAGQKRAAPEIRETTETHEVETRRPDVDTPNSKRRRVQTHVGYNLPVPGDPEYRHVNEERGTTASATGSPEPSERTRGWSVAVPDDSDDEDKEIVGPSQPAKAASVPLNPSNWIGIPDDFYDTSSDEEDEEMAPPPAPVPPEATSTTGTVQDATPTAPPATPYAHKYTPHKPSGLRAVETMASSPIPPQATVPITEITPPLSPTVSPVFQELVDAYLLANPPKKPFSFADYPEIECSDLTNRVAVAYKDLLMKRNEMIAG